MNSSRSESTNRMFFWAKLFASFFLSLLILSTMAHAQSLGTITGTATDQSGAVVPKANVTLVNEGTAESRTTVSNEAGYYSFAAVTPGTYTVKVTVTGFKAWEHKGVPVRPGDLRDVSAS